MIDRIASLSNTPLRRWAPIVLVVAAVVLPFVATPFFVFQVTMLFAYIVALIGLNLLVGHSGQISLGHAAFFCIGAYTGAIVARQVDGVLGYLLAVPLAAALCFVVGYLFGIPALRLRGLNLALGTLALTVAAGPLLKRFDGVTGGVVGLSVPLADPPEATGLFRDQWVYCLALVVLIFATVVSRNILRGSVGRALNSVRDNEIAAQAMGVDTARFKTIAFALASMFGGLGGVIYTWATAYVSPDGFTLMLSVYFLAGIIVGGLGTNLGPYIGAAFIYFVPGQIGRINDAAPGIVFGAVLIVIVLAAPGGIAGALSKAWGTIVERGSRRSVPTADGHVVSETAP